MPVAQRNGNGNYALTNWLVLFLLCFVLANIIDNYITYGIIRSPLQVITDAYDVLINWWWLVALFCLVIMLQIVICIVLEKCLLLRQISENKGAVLHTVNVFLLYNVFAYICFRQKLHGILAFILSQHIFFPTVKLLSYQLNNRRIRIKNGHTSDSKSDQNIKIEHFKMGSLKHLFRYMFCCGCVVYKFHTWKRGKGGCTSISSLTLFILRRVAFLLACSLIMHQYVMPELQNASYYIDTRQHLNLLSTFFKLALPVHIVWLAFFYFYLIEVCYKLPVMLFGTDFITYTKDWWNSPNIAVYWATWNYPSHLFFKDEIFMPALEMGFSKRKAACAVGVVSGAIHEYLWAVPFGIGYGGAFLIMMAQIPFSSLSRYISCTFGNQWGNVLVWMQLIIGHTLYAILIHYFTQYLPNKSTI